MNRSGTAVRAVPDVDAGSRTVISGVVKTTEGPLAGAWVRLLDQSGEFVGEMVTPPNGGFRFYLTPGSWVLRVLSARGVAETPVQARLGQITRVAIEVSQRVTERVEV